ncbi:MAG: hypothetical protein MI921_21630 [Cytophagales bacterium]|nr:hypothetical protein [Cytophagales bacterium]
MHITKKTLLLIWTISPILFVSAQSDQSIYFVAGMPDKNFYQDDYRQTYTANILEYERDTLREITTLSDSSQFLDFLRYYPHLNAVLALNTKGFDEKYGVELIEFSTRNLTTKYLKIPKTREFQGREYSAYLQSIGIIIENDSTKYCLRYVNLSSEINDSEYLPEYFRIIQNSDFSLVDESVPGDVYRNGGIAGPLFRSNGGILTLQGDPSEKLLVIPSFLEKDSVFQTKIPEKALPIPRRNAATLLINSNQIRLLFFRRTKSREAFYDFYNKEQDRYYQYPFDDNNLCVKQYGDWICGPTRLQYVEKGTYQGKHPGQDQWITKHNKYSLSIPEYMDRNIKKMILSGYLAIRSIYDPSIFIEWNTQQGDSEILNVIDDTVYYRKHDEIWYVPIVNGQALGEHQLLLKNEVVPAIHFMFTREE